MSGQIRDYDNSHTLAAGAEVPVHATGRLIQIYDLTADTLEISVNDSDFFQISSETDYKIPLEFEDDYFTKVIVKNTGGSAITFRLRVGFGELNDKRFTNSSTVSISGNVTVVSAAPTLASSTDSVLTVASKKVITGATTQKRVMVSNLAANGTVIYVGDSAVSATEGIEIPIGSALELDTQSDIYVYNPSAGTINVGLVVLSGT